MTNKFDTYLRSNLKNKNNKENKSNLYISDVIKNEYIEKWKKNDMIFIFAGTGSGKTTFVLNTILSSYINNNKILYLVPREILKKQIEIRITEIAAKPENRYKAKEYSTNIQVCTYQYIEELLIKNKHKINNTNINKFDLIICDEFHYFITDCTFNSNTQISYDFIFHNEKNKSIKLLLTATPDIIMQYVKKDILNKMEYDYCNFYKDFDNQWETTPGEDVIEKIDNILNKNKNLIINKEYVREHIITRYFNIYMYKLSYNYSYLNIKYITQDNEIIEMIKNSNENKTVIFINNKEKGQKFKESLDKDNIANLYINAENKNTENKEDIKTLTDTDTFKEQVLITTSVLDVGINLNDIKIENIVIATTEPIEFIQMLGRIRLTKKSQKINLFIYQRDINYFQKLKNNYIQNKLKSIKFLEIYEKNNDLSEILQDKLRKPYKFPKDCEEFLYIENEKIKINELTKYSFRTLYNLYGEICDKMKEDKNGFIKKQLEWLGLENTFSEKNFYRQEISKNYIEILQKNIEEEIEKTKNKNGMCLKDCQEMLKKFKILIRNIDNKNTRSNTALSIKNFNTLCKKYNIPYCIGQQKNVKENTKYYLLEINDKKINELKLEIKFK